MNILFVHQNFPGQFRHVAAALKARGHNVSAVTATGNPQRTEIPTWSYNWDKRNYPFETYRHARGYAEMAFRGEIVAKVCAQLKQQKHLMPDVVVSHPGWGEALFLRDVWPNARHLMFAEFYYAPYGRDTNYDPEFQQDSHDMRLGILARRAHLLQSLEQADELLSPTRWQAASLPEFLKARTHVIHDGIDTQAVLPAAGKMKMSMPGTTLKFQSGDEIVTFINRNLEPYRGYHIFMRALVKVLKARPNARAVIVGGSDQGYSPSRPDGMTWKDAIFDEVKDQLDLSRVHLVGRVPYDTFLDLMRVSRVHAYLTYPFVLSWSTLEAMAAGALVVGSKTPPVEEVIMHGQNGLLVDFFDVAAWADTLTECLAKPEQFALLRVAARQTVVERYDLKTVCLPKQIEIVERLGTRPA